MTKERLINSGLYDLATAYQSVHINYWKRCIREPYVQCCERTAVSHRLLLDWFYSSYIYPVIPPTKASVFSVLPQEHFLLDILGVPLVGMQSIRRALVGLPLHFPQYCIEGHWQRLLSRNRWCAKNAFQRRSFWYFFLCHYYPEGLKHPVNTLGDTHRLQRNFLFFLTFFLAKNLKKTE